MTPTATNIPEADQYEALAPVYDRWIAGGHYQEWAEFIAARLPASDTAPRRVLDLCCGTGTLAELLAERGFAVTGVDRSPAMLREARQRLPEDTSLVCAELLEFRPDSVFDGVVCTFDSINYLVEDGELTIAFSTAHRALRSGGVFVFDVNTGHKLEHVFGDSHYGDDLDDFAYVWRNTYTPSTRRITFDITVFRQRSDGAYDRKTEHHDQRWFTHAEIEAAASAVGLEVAEVVDDYGTKPPGSTTLRESWVLRKP